MNKIKKIIFITLSISLGSIGGVFLSSSSAEARLPCQDLSCRSDMLGGDRCFSVTGGEGWDCNDSGYPSCFMTNCTVPGESG
tara:strand:+ start:19926 stop:20171 length:246 start_codon:yes stop_codon:yes gene_type:complete